MLHCFRHFCKYCCIRAQSLCRCYRCAFCREVVCNVYVVWSRAVWCHSWRWVHRGHYQFFYLFIYSERFFDRTPTISGGTIAFFTLVWVSERASLPQFWNRFLDPKIYVFGLTMGGGIEWIRVCYVFIDFGWILGDVVPVVALIGRGPLSHFFRIIFWTQTYNLRGTI